MTSDDDAGPLTGVAILLISLVLLWSGVLAVGFVWKAVADSGEMSLGRTVTFYVIASVSASTPTQLRRTQLGWRTPGRTPRCTR